ncbi:MAG: vWA domain-containing protein [Anaerostipes sp.]|jgi:uncharacterized protein YegL
MNAELTELVFILDRSGSMSGLEDDTIGGFNGMIAKQKSEAEKVNVTTVLFDDEVEVIHDRFSIDIVEPLTEKEYYVRGCTALLDAVGESIKKIENVQKHLPDAHKAGKVIFVITTDGHENSSKEYNYSDIKRMIEAKKECGWEFLFLGANIDARKEAEKIGIARNRSVTYENDHRGVALNYATVGKAISKAAQSRNCSAELDDDWAEDISVYHEEKHKK